MALFVGIILSYLSLKIIIVMTDKHVIVSLYLKLALAIRLKHCTLSKAIEFKVL